MTSTERVRRWKLANPERAREQGRRNSKKRYHAAHDLVLEAKRSPCVDCGVQLPAPVMHLDHVRGEKSFELGQSGLGGRAISAVADEIAKCDVRCPNCHCLRHYYAREQ